MNGIIQALAIVAAVAAWLPACGSSLEQAGSSISISITSPATTSDVDVTSDIVAEISDPDGVGISVPASWSSVFRLRALGSEDNICTDDVIAYDAGANPQTVTCSPGVLDPVTQYALSISGMTDSADARIDPASMAFATGTP